MVTTTIRMPLTHRRLPVLALALVVMAFAVTSPLLASAYDFDGPVVGEEREPGFADGMHGVSRITSPSTMCIYTPPHADRVGGPDDVVMVVADGYFRMYDRTIGVTTTLRTAAGDLFRHTDGNITGCAQHKKPAQVPIVYYVSGDSKVNWIQDGNVHSITVTPSNTTKFIGVDVQDDRLFLMTTDMDAVWSCALSSTGPANCRMHTFPASLTWTHTGTAVITVIPKMFFVATTENFYAFAVPSENDTAVPKLMVNGAEVDFHLYTNVNIVSIHKSADDTIYGVAIGGSIYTFEDAYMTPSIVIRRLSSNCPYTDAHVFSREEMYMTQPDCHMVHGFCISRSRVFVSLPRPPVPAGMDDGTETLYAVAREVQRAAAKLAPNAGGVFVSTADISVDASTWSSTVPVQTYKSSDDDKERIHSADYSAALVPVAAYYERANQVVPIDAFMLPMCDGELMRSMESVIANHTIELLQYPVIYTMPINAAAAADGITPVKLLMPAHFNNKTTESTLAAGDFNMAILKELRRAVPADHRYIVKLSRENVDLGAFSERRRQRARAVAQRFAVQRLDQCGRSSHVVAASSSVSCTAPAVGVSRIVADDDGGSHIEVFLSPEAYPGAGTGMTFAECLDGANWAGIGAASAESDNKSKCGKGCIIGVSVGCACAVLIIIAIVAVFIVRRRKTQAREDGKGAQKSLQHSDSDKEEPFPSTTK